MEALAVANDFHTEIYNFQFHTIFRVARAKYSRFAFAIETHVCTSVDK